MARTAMTGELARRLASLGHTLPPPTPPHGLYRPFLAWNGQIWIARGTSIRGMYHHRGKLGHALDRDQGRTAAALAALNVLAELDAACAGNLDCIERVVRMAGFVNSAPDFADQPYVLDGASQILIDVFGAAGRHSRVAIGTGAHPKNVAVEIEVVFALRDAGGTARPPIRDRAPDASGGAERRLAALGIALPPAGSAAGNYLPHARVGNWVWSGRGPTVAGKRYYQGKLGRDLGVEEGRAAARLTALNLVAEARAACDGSLDSVRGVARLAGFINCTEDFADHPKVMDAASEVLTDIFGARGRHNRLAVGCPGLPGGIAVEIEALFEVEDDAT